jgi:antitoxin PrlF
MREFVASVTQRGQVTIPAEVRKLLGLRQGEKVSFIVEDGEVILRQPRFTIETAYGSVKALKGDIDEMIREAKEERAESFMRKLREE